MAFVLSLVALLPLISLTTAGPSRVPKCIERANPFDDPCIEDLEADTQSVSLEGRDELALSPSFRTIQFVDTFNHPNVSTSSYNLTYSSPEYPQGLALSYPGFSYSDVKSRDLLMPSPPEVLITNSTIQNDMGRQPGIIRQSNTTSFDLRSIRFACAYADEDSQLSPASCLVTFACDPKTSNDTGIPSGHRPTPRPMVRNTFEFVPNIDHSSLSWPNPADPNTTTGPTTKATLYAHAEVGDEYYDLDHCYIMLQQYASPFQASDIPPAVLIDDVVGVAYYEDQAS